MVVVVVVVGVVEYDELVVVVGAVGLDLCFV